MHATVELAEPVFREVKSRAIQEGVTLEQLIANYVVAGLRGAEHSSSAPSKPQVERPPIPIARRANGTATPALTNAQLNQILEDEDIENFRRVTHG